MGRIRANGHRRALVGVFAVAALALAACIPSNPPRPPVPPEAAFSVSTAPLVASFTDESTGVINSRSWDFGDGETSTEQSPTHTYATHGVYAVSLTVTGPGGTDTATQDVTVNPPAPLASFTAEPPSGTVPLTVFLASTSTGVIDSVAWDLNSDSLFDDATGPTATHTFDAAGDHTVGLSVTGPGGTSTTNKAISVALPPPPVASFAAVPTSGVAPLTVTFADTSTGDITARSWDFDGDGNGDAAGEAASHVFEAAGSYLVALTVTGPGGSNTTSQTITVNVPPPVASFTAAPITGTAPLSVQFTNTSTGNITSMTWTLGNGTGFVDDTLPFDEPVQTTYDAPATYTATLTVSGPGGSDTASQSVTVNAPNTAPTLEIAAPANGASFPALTNVTFTGTANDSEDGNISSSIQWSSSIDGVLGTGASISEGNLSSGTHTITASVSDSDGAPATAQITITITTPATTTTTTQPPPTLPDPPDECFPRRCEPRDPGDDPPDRR